jgi:hypothetical protein
MTQWVLTFVDNGSGVLANQYTLTQPTGGGAAWTVVSVFVIAGQRQYAILWGR